MNSFMNFLNNKFAPRAKKLQIISGLLQLKIQYWKCCHLFLLVH